MGLPTPSRNFEQNSPITTILRQICEAYPESSCLRELLQNADDAQASEIEYILDTTTYHDTPLLNEGLQAYHGPALLVKNNSVFADDDFASLASIGDSRKRDDPASTDPHREWSRDCGGPTYDFVACQSSHEMQNHLKVFKAAEVDTSHAVESTIIRIPLRTKDQATKSKIVNREISIDEITKALHELGQEIKDGGMLFLKHVRKVTAKIDSTVLWQAQAKGATEEDNQAMESISGSFGKMYAHPQGVVKSPEKLSRAFYVNVEYLAQSSSSIHSFFVQHTMTRLTKNTALNDWACKRKLYPWVAVAAPLKEIALVADQNLQSSQREAHRGRLFSCLRMPVETNQPVHIHGLFAIVPDRSRLSSSGPDSEWNRFMFDECISVAWTDLLFARRLKAWEHECFDLWPRISTPDSRELWSCLDNLVLKQIFASDLPVWNTPKCCVSLQNGLFAPNEEDVKLYSNAFSSVKLPLVSLERPMYDKVLLQAVEMAKTVPIISPQLVRQFLQEHSQLQVHRDYSSLLLQYCLLDFIPKARAFRTPTEIRFALANIPLWPTVNKSLAALTDTPFLLPRGPEEMQLFRASRPSETLDLDCLLEPVVKLLEECTKHPSSFVRYRAIPDLESDWGSLYPLQSSNTRSDICTREPEDDSKIQTVWSWIYARCKEEGESSIVSTKGLDKLFLVPVDGLRIRRISPSDKKQPTLIIQDGDWIHDLLNNEVTKDKCPLGPVLDVKCLPAKAVKLLRSLARKRPDTALASLDQLQSLVTWLVTNRDVLENHPVRHKELLVRQLRLLAEQNDSPTQVPSKALLKQQIVQLPIFTQVTAVAPYEDYISRRTAIDTSFRAVQITSALPPIPAIPGLVFYEPSDLNERYLVNVYGLLEKVPLDDLMFDHLLPFLEDNPDPVLAGVKLSLVSFMLDKVSHLSDTWKARFCKMKLVPRAPTPSISELQFRSLAHTFDPTSRLSDLFFEEDDVFPEPDFFKRHRDKLVSCGIIRELNSEILLDRARAFAGSQRSPEQLKDKVKHMLNLSLAGTFNLSPASLKELRSLEWLPVSIMSSEGLRLMSATDCRAADDKALVDTVLGIVEVDITSEWRRLLGWDQEIEKSTLAKQLELSLISESSDRIDAVLSYLGRLEDCQLIQQTPCILTRRGEYALAEHVLLPGSLLSIYSLSPYLDEVDISFMKKHMRLLTAMNIRQHISFSDLLEVQANVEKSTQSNALSDDNLNVVLALLEIAARLDGEADHLSAMLIPDTEKRLRPRTDIVHGDRNVKGKIASFNFVHPRISPDLVERLDIEKSISRAIRLDIEFEDEEEDEYVPREKLSTTISDTLGRYHIDSTFGEFLANANDCGATQISWILDGCAEGAYESSTLLGEELKDLQGPALFVFNDGVFSEKDFEGFKDIGHGGKIDNETSTGMFGRGAMTMYHFTDVPMLISGGYFLILDPQQHCLPRNKHGRHKAGMKIPLTTVRRLFPDQLRPFEGLHNYSIDLDSYEGTLYRFPLRMTNQTLLKEDCADMGFQQTKILMEDYYSTAQMSPLFLRNVSAIDFGIRGQSASWSVKCERSSSSFDETFQLVIIESKRGVDEAQKASWRVGIMDIEEAPGELANAGRRANKITECGLAACIEKTGHTAGKRASEQRVYCTLPTTSQSDLPVSIHASFAITGDRKTIPFEDFERTSPIKEWNRWLLTQCIPDFYIDFLKDLAPRLGEASFKFWPTRSRFPSIHSFGKVVQEAFWTRLASSQYEDYQLYPLYDTHDSSERSTPLKTRAGGKVRKVFRVASLKSAQFDALPEDFSAELRPLFRKLCPSLVHPPQRLWELMTASKIHRQAEALDAEHICKLFKDDANCAVLQDWLVKEGGYRDNAIEMLLRIVVGTLSLDAPPSIEIVHNCRIIPKLDQSLGTVRFRDEDSKPFCDQDLLHLPTATEAKLFVDCTKSLIKPTLFQTIFGAFKYSTDTTLKAPKNPLRAMMTKNSNIREITVVDIHSFLPHNDPSSAPASTLGSSHNWIVYLWGYLNPRLEAYLAGEGAKPCSGPISDLLKHLKLHDTPIYRYLEGEQWCYITPEQFGKGSYVVRPTDPKQRELCSMLHGVKVVDDECVPSQLRGTESNLTSPLPFRRLLRAIAARPKYDSVNLFKEGVKNESIALLRTSIQAFAIRGNAIDGHDKNTIRSLPVWPRYNAHADLSANMPPYITINNAFTCPQKSMLQPWVQNKQRFIDPDVVYKFSVTLEALGCSIMNAQSTWKHLEPELPRNLKPDQVQGYLRWIECLAYNAFYPRAKIAPNGWNVLCDPASLFDHEDSIFLAAFEESDSGHFLHPAFHKKRDFWIKVGLRNRISGVMDASDFLECVNQLTMRLSIPASRSRVFQDAEKVTGYLRLFNPGFGYWPDQTWTMIARAKMYRANPNVTFEPFHRRKRMTSLSNDSTPLCINDAAPETHKAILWSQRPFLQGEPDAKVYNKLPDGGRPNVQLVYNHLQFLINMRHDVGERELPEYLIDLQATYSYLQEHRTATVSILCIREAKVWLNLPTTVLTSITSSQLDVSLRSAKSLCLNAPLDTHMMERVKNFLVPYETLLKALGCQSMVQPPKQKMASHGKKQRPLDHIWAALRDMRKQGQLTDVIFETEGQQVCANRNIMAASSEYCRAQFLGDWGSILGPKATIQVTDLSIKTLNYVVDFAYAGDVQWPQLQDPGDINEVADTLDELLDLLRGADMWFVEMLHDLTEQYLLDHSESFIRPDNVDSVKELADAGRAKRLVDHCDAFIRVNARFVQDCRDMK
ncbi:MAG: hypothetical protein Q9170_006784 [Blastenia crenularia]